MNPKELRQQYTRNLERQRGGGQEQTQEESLIEKILNCFLTSWKTDPTNNCLLLKYSNKGFGQEWLQVEYNGKTLGGFHLTKDVNIHSIVKKINETEGYCVSPPRYLILRNPKQATWKIEIKIIE